MAIFRRPVRAMCGKKLLDTRETEEVVGMLRLEKSVEQLARANGMQW